MVGRAERQPPLAAQGRPAAAAAAAVVRAVPLVAVRAVCRGCVVGCSRL